jgi:hypothetical protein
MYKIASFIVSLGLFVSVGMVMSPTTHLACMMPTMMAQGIPSPPEGNPNHEEPAPGSNCVHNPAAPDHNCTCHKHCEQNPDGTNSAVVVEDNVRCRSACYKDHCACRAENCE